MQKILFGVFFVIGGLSGLLVLRGTHSSKALVVVGYGLIVWGLFQIRSEQATERRGNVLGGEPSRPEPRMNPSEIELWIARELGRLQKPENLIATVCERTGMNWGDAKALIRRVQDQKGKTIGRGQRRFAMTYGLPIVIAGLIVIAGSTYGLIQITNGSESERIPGSMYCGLGIGLFMTVAGLYVLFRSRGQAAVE